MHSPSKSRHTKSIKVNENEENLEKKKNTKKLEIKEF
jgi:hypothetical protein